MRKIIKLTESDLIGLIKKVINEQSEDVSFNDPKDYKRFVKGIIDGQYSINEVEKILNHHRNNLLNKDKDEKWSNTFKDMLTVTYDAANKNSMFKLYVKNNDISEHIDVSDEEFNLEKRKEIDKKLREKGFQYGPDYVIQRTRGGDRDMSKINLMLNPQNGFR